MFMQPSLMKILYMRVTQYLFMEPSLMKIHLSLVLCSGIIVDHLAAENQVPELH